MTRLCSYYVYIGFSVYSRSQPKNDRNIGDWRYEGRNTKMEIDYFHRHNAEGFWKATIFGIRRIFAFDCRCNVIGSHTQKTATRAHIRTHHLEGARCTNEENVHVCMLWILENQIHGAHFSFVVLCSVLLSKLSRWLKRQICHQSSTFVRLRLVWGKSRISPPKKWSILLTNNRNSLDKYATVSVERYLLSRKLLQINDVAMNDAQWTVIVICIDI